MQFGPSSRLKIINVAVTGSLVQIAATLHGGSGFDDTNETPRPCRSHRMVYALKQARGQSRSSIRSEQCNRWASLRSALESAASVKLVVQISILLPCQRHEGLSDEPLP